MELLMEEIINELLEDGLIDRFNETSYIKTDIYYEFLESRRRKVGYLKDIELLKKEQDRLIAYNNDLSKLVASGGIAMSKSYGLATFLKDADVPRFSKPNSSFKNGYVVRAYSDTGDKLFRKLIPTEAKLLEISEEQFYINLVKCTNHYYLTTDMPKTSIKYFSENIWRSVYEEYFSNLSEEDTSKWDKLG